MSTNISTELKGTKLHIIVDVSKQSKDNAPLSASRKNKVVASSNGFMRVEDAGVSVGLNVICK